jgi:hypothetical protein
MRRLIGLLTVALTLVAGSAALTASAASASAGSGIFIGHGFYTNGKWSANSYPEFLHGEVPYSPYYGFTEILKFSTEESSWSVACAGATYGSGKLTEASTTIELTPHYSNCKFVPTNPYYPSMKAEVAVNSCRYRFNPLSSGTEDEWVGNESIICNEGDSISIDLAESTCEYHLMPQTMTGNQTGFDNQVVQPYEWYPPVNRVVTYSQEEGVQYEVKHYAQCALPLGYNAKGLHTDGTREVNMFIS